MVKCKNFKEVGEAIKNKESEFYVEADLKNKILKLRATGPVAWAVCAGCLAVAIISVKVGTATIVPAPAAGGASYFISGVSTAAAAATLGSAVIPAVIIGVSAGGIGGLNALRNKYTIKEKGDNYIILKRK